MSEEIFFEVGSRIAALRGAMKQSEFGERLGVNRQTVSRWEAGERLPDGSSMQQMALLFGADISYILTGKSGGAAPTLRPDEEALLEHYRAAHSDARERIRQIAATAANSPKRAKHIEQHNSPGAVAGNNNQVINSRVRGNVIGGSINVSSNTVNGKKEK